MAKKIVEDLKVNKITKALYDQYVANGVITPSMIEEQAWLFTDQAFLDQATVNRILNQSNPTKLSQLANDVGYITEASIPKNVSQLNNDRNYATIDNIPTKTSQLTNDSSYATTSQLPTKMSQLNNDIGLATTSSIPTKLSQLTNDANYAKINNIPTDVSQLNNDVGYALSTEIPTKVSQLINDNSYATTSQLPTKTSQLTNDSNLAYANQIPTKVSDLTNDSKFVKENDPVTKLNNDAGYLTEEVDPTVPAWAKTPNKPTYTKAEVGLGNVDNKSSATIRSELTTKNITDALGFVPLDEAVKGVAGGVATLGIDGTIPSTQLPSYVDDVVEYDIKAHFPTTGEPGKIYVDCSNNTTWRWSGTQYTSIGADIALGETSSTAFRGDYGKIAYDHAKSKHAPSDAEENIIDAIAVNGVIQPVADKTAYLTVPTKLSELTNDVGYSEATEIPTKVSQLVNDSNFVKQSELPTDLSQFNNDEGFIKSTDVPTKVSQLANDSNYVKVSELPTNVSTFTNDANYATVSQIPTKTSQLTNDSNYVKSSELPTKLSSFTNDEGFIKSSDIPTNLSDFTNDEGFITSDDIPTKLSDFTNDEGFITADSDITGNATSAGKLKNAVNLSITDHDGEYTGTATSFDGSANKSIKMPENFKGTLHGNVKTDISNSWINSAEGSSVIDVKDSEDNTYNSLYSMRTKYGAYTVGCYRHENATSKGFNIAYFKNETLEAGTNTPDYVWNFDEEGSLKPSFGKGTLGNKDFRWENVFTNQISTVHSYQYCGMFFCELPKTRTGNRCEASFLLSGFGSYMSGSIGTYIVSCSNFNSQPSMRVTSLQDIEPDDGFILRFGYYETSTSYVFGTWTNQTTMQRNVICINKDVTDSSYINIGLIKNDNILPDNFVEVKVKSPASDQYLFYNEDEDCLDFIFPEVG